MLFVGMLRKVLCLNNANVGLENEMKMNVCDENDRSFRFIVVRVVQGRRAYAIGYSICQGPMLPAAWYDAANLAYPPGLQFGMWEGGSWGVRWAGGMKPLRADDLQHASSPSNSATKTLDAFCGFSPSLARIKAGSAGVRPAKRTLSPTKSNTFIWLSGWNPSKEFFCHVVRTCGNVCPVFGFILPLIVLRFYSHQNAALLTLARRLPLTSTHASKPR